ncbi:hypothetical protein [Sphingobacterium wenxiniae]|uniref:Uncharacterized protein n=1 Tax=Sphingobacterium wenxiniae TaxID=683125 RepID=A0A1I6VL00_9SPHI|nr:hypothetical protein [Sphingobacterium wenxiniae]SFT14412.1 hypothetical protein SAMN05660206_1158 [Sphingobacterium wenxiniae]
MLIIFWSIVVVWQLTDQALGARAGALLQARVRGQSRRAVLRQAPDPLRGKPGGISSQRFSSLAKERKIEAESFNFART